MPSKVLYNQDSKGVPIDMEAPGSSPFPSRIGKVVPAALASEGIYTLEQAARYTEKELLAIHGVGRKGLQILKEELTERVLKLSSSSVRYGSFVKLRICKKLTV
jgi:hypothetical protein